jgi:hypothetical protein
MLTAEAERHIARWPGPPAVRQAIISGASRVLLDGLDDANLTKLCQMDEELALSVLRAVRPEPRPAHPPAMVRARGCKAAPCLHPRGCARQAAAALARPRAASASQDPAPWHCSCRACCAAWARSRRRALSQPAVLRAALQVGSLISRVADAFSREQLAATDAQLAASGAQPSVDKAPAFVRMWRGPEQARMLLVQMFAKGKLERGELGPAELQLILRLPTGASCAAATPLCHFAAPWLPRLPGGLLLLCRAQARAAPGLLCRGRRLWCRAHCTAACWLADPACPLRAADQSKVELVGKLPMFKKKGRLGELPEIITSAQRAAAAGGGGSAGGAGAEQQQQQQQRHRARSRSPAGRQGHGAAGGRRHSPNSRAKVLY